MTFSQVLFAPGNSEKYCKLHKEMKPDHDRKWLTLQAQMYWHRSWSRKELQFSKRCGILVSLLSQYDVCVLEYNPVTSAQKWCFCNKRGLNPGVCGFDTQESQAFPFDLFIMCQYCGFQMLYEPDFPSSRWAMWVMAMAKGAKGVSYSQWVTGRLRLDSY